jgi:hypothetical protein
MSDFEQEIEHELHRVLDPALPGTIPAWRVPRPWSMTKRILGGAGFALGFKVLTGVVLAAAAATVAGAATETVVTGSANPSVWGQQVKLQVEACKDKLAAGNLAKHGIGECMSEFTSRHEEPASESNQAPDTTDTKNPGAKKPAHPASPAKNPGHPEPQPSAPKHSSASSQPPAQGRGFDGEPTDPAINTSAVKPAPR